MNSPTAIVIKEYLTAQEAADYCCVSLSQFKKKIPADLSRQHWGRTVYRLNDLRELMERQWHDTTKGHISVGEGSPGYSTTTMAASGSAEALGRFLKAKRRVA